MILCRYVAVCFQVEASEAHIWLYFYSFTSHSLSHLKAFKFVCWLCYFSRSIWLMDDFTDFFFLFVIASWWFLWILNRFGLIFREHYPLLEFIACILILENLFVLWSWLILCPAKIGVCHVLFCMNFSHLYRTTMILLITYLSRISMCV